MIFAGNVLVGKLWGGGVNGWRAWVWRQVWKFMNDVRLEPIRYYHTYRCSSRLHR